MMVRQLDIVLDHSQDQGRMDEVHEAVKSRV